MSNLVKFKIPYKPRDFQKKLHKSCDSHKKYLAIIARQSGKTTFMINQLIKGVLTCKRTMPNAGYIAPQRKQAKEIIWDALKYYACSNKSLPTESNETDLTVRFPTINGGAKITLYGAENAEALRGRSFDWLGVDEVGDISKETLTTILYPTLRGVNGNLIVSGTPKGFNLLYDLYQIAQTDPEWAYHLYTIHDVGLYTPEEIEEERQRSMALHNGSDTIFRQEYLCEFLASSDSVLIPIELTMKAMDRMYSDQDVANYELVYGLDIAGDGGDNTILVKRQGPKIKDIKKLSGDTDRIADLVYIEAQKDRPDRIHTDKGYNPGVTDRLRRLGLNPIGINFGGNANDRDKYANKRAEMWDNGKMWLEAGGQIPKTEEGEKLARELSSVNMVDDGQGFKNRLQLESKKSMKSRSIPSPDRADAFVLTLAYPSCVYANRFSHTNHMEEAKDWNPLEVYA